MNGALTMDPAVLGVLTAASAGLEATGLQRHPTSLGQNIGSMLGAGANAYAQAMRARMDEQMRGRAIGVQEGQLTESRRMHDAQIKQFDAAEQERRQRLNESMRRQAAEAQFRTRLPEAADQIDVLRLGAETGALGAHEYAQQYSQVLDRKAAREQRMQELEMRLQDSRTQAADRAQLQTQLAQMRTDAQRDLVRLSASMRPQPQEPLVPVQQGEQVLYVPRSQAVGQPVGRPHAASNLTEGEAKGTLFYRQMKSANDTIGQIVGPNFDVTKVGGQLDTRLTGSDWTNWMASAPAQQYAQAAEQWSEAYLRLKTGAATTKDEIKRNARAYFPQPGDSATVIAQKNEMRRRAEEDVSIVAGRGATQAPRVTAGEAPKPWERQWPTR